MPLASARQRPERNKLPDGRARRPANGTGQWPIGSGLKKKNGGLSSIGSGHKSCHVENTEIQTSRSSQSSLCQLRFHISQTACPSNHKHVSNTSAKCCTKHIKNSKTHQNHHERRIYSTQTSQLQDHLAANREFSAATRQSGAQTQKRTSPSRPAKTVRMAAVHYVYPFTAKNHGGNSPDSCRPVGMEN